MSVPLFANKPSLEPLLAEVAERQRAVLEGGRYILGPEVEAFESEFAEFLGAPHCVGVANGTDALQIGLRALGVGPGDEVVVPAVTFFATPEAVVNVGATPVFCDIDPDTWLMTAETAEPAITSKTKAFLPVHLFGNPAPVADLVALGEERGIKVLEDAAQAHGATLGGDKAGVLGHAATFSFFPSKNLGAFGDAGAVVTTDPEVEALSRRLRFHGSEDKRTHTEIGYNSRLDELQAAGLRVHLPHLAAWTASRRAAAQGYADAGLGDLVKLQAETEGAESCFHLYVVSHPDRDELREQLTEAGIGARPYYEIPLYEQPAMAEYSNGKLEVTEKVCAEILALPMGTALDEAAPAQVTEAVGAALGARA